MYLDYTSYQGAQDQPDLMPQSWALKIEDLCPGSSLCKALTQLHTQLVPSHPFNISYNVTSSKNLPELPHLKKDSLSPLHPTHTPLLSLSLNSYSSPSQHLAWAWASLSSDPLLTLPCVSSYVSAGFWLGLANGNHWGKGEGTRRINASYLLCLSLPWEASLFLLGSSERPPQFQLLHMGSSNATSFHSLRLTVVAASCGV